MHNLIQSIKKRADFKVVLQHGKKAVTKSIVMFVKSSDEIKSIDARLGIIVTKKNGISVIRNRIKRRLRAAFLQISLLKSLSDVDIVVIARKNSLEVNFSMLLNEILYCLKSTANI